MDGLDVATAPALDAVTELLLAEGAPLQAPVAVLDDVGAALTAALQAQGHQPRVWCDDVREERAAAAHLRVGFPEPADEEVPKSPAEAVTGARTVLWRLPKSLSALDEYAQLIATHADPHVRVIAAAPDKHLNRSMNEVLARHFESVRASRGHRKARALVTSGPLASDPQWPKLVRMDALELTVAAHGATFNTWRLDRGTALLASVLDGAPDAGHAIDLGCGSGVLAALLAKNGWQVDGVDVTWSGCDATRLTAQANGLSIAVQRRDGLAGWPEPVDLIVCNPPFHVGVAKDTEPTRALFAQAGPALVEEGQFWCVFNAHLPYLPWLRRAIGPTTIIARDRGYLVTRSVRRAEGVGEAE